MKSKIIILILGIFIIDILAASYTAELRSHTDDYDITTIYKIQSKYTEDAYKINPSNNSIYYNDVEIHLRTNAIGMPIQFNEHILSSKTKSLEFIADKKYPTNILTQNEVAYSTNEWIIKTFSMTNDHSKFTPFNYNLLLWDAVKNEESFKVSWNQKNKVQTCISVSYILNDVSKCTFSMEIINENDSNQVYSYNFEEAKDLKTVLIKTNELLMTNVTYSINMKLKKKFELKQIETRYRHNYYGTYYSDYVTETVYADGCTIGIKRIAQCLDTYANEELLTITTEEFQKTSLSTFAFNVYPFGSIPIRSSLSSSQSSTLTLKCLNGGFAYKDKCICPPGFKGNNCDYACGPNTFGVDCSGMCSMHHTCCQQMMFCTNNFGCKCPTGYKGYNCKIECASGTYGVNCEQKCSKRCNAEACDKFTGVCTEGCKKSYIPPNCNEKYPWLNHPIQLESSNFQSIKLKLNLSSENKNGSNKINSVYYQIIFKPTLNDSEFQYMEFKEIGKQESVIETIENLTPGISYSFGVILISEDGNYNYEDIQIIKYSTLCPSPTISDYDVNILSGINYIKVTWNELYNQDENECKITEYLLKLMFNSTIIQQKSYSEEIKSKNNNGHIFENLISGQKYAINVTAISAIGQVKSSKISYISTEHYGFVEIKNIKAKLHDNQSAVVLTWDIDDKYETPLTYIVKYKVNRYYSCSFKVIANNWTSLYVYNETKRDIWDLKPNTQYVIKVEPTIKGYNYNDYENVIYIKTSISAPKLIPINNEYSSYVTNQTASFNWTIDMNECSKLNGFFSGYHIVLRNIVEGTQKLNTTKHNTVNYDELKPETKYELQVYVKTNYGFNPEQGLIIPFKTKFKFLEPVNNLTVYKKNLKLKSIGLRWSFLEQYDNINGFIITVINKKIDFEKQITVKPQKCICWPTFYCTTLEDLIPNDQYTIKMKAKSLDYPTGGWPASIDSNFEDGFSEKPENLRATTIGSKHVTLEWDIPWIFNGVLKSFIINTEEISSKDMTKCCDSIPDIEIKIIEEISNYNHTVYNLKPESTYSIGVLSRTASYGQTNKIHVTTLSDN